MAREYIEKYDLLNTGREKLNRSIDKCYDAEETSVQALKDANDLGNQAISDANKLGNEAKQISIEKGNESISIAKENEKVANEANLIAQDTNDRMNQIISGTTDSAEIIDARKPTGLEPTETLGERLNLQFGNSSDFRPEEVSLTQKMKTEFNERGANVQNFGAISNDISFDNSASFIKALSNNNHIIIPEGTYYFKNNIEIRKSNVLIESLGAKLIASEPMNHLIEIGHKNAPSYISDIEFKGVLRIDSNLKARNGIFVMNAKDVNLNNITSSNSIEHDFLIDLDKNNDSEWPSITNEVYLKGCRSTNSDWKNANKESTGLRINTSDCFVFDFKTIHKTKAIFNGGNNFYDKVHSWIINEWQMNNGVFFTTTSTATLHNAYADTYPVDYEILNKVNMSLLNCFSYYNQNYYTLEKITNKELPLPVKFKFKDWESATSNIRATNCTLSGAEKGGGFLTNRKEYPFGIDLINCNLQYLQTVPLSKNLKENLKLSFEEEDMKIDKASTWVNKKTQLGAVRIKPLNLIVEDMDGDFSKKNKWVVKWINSNKPDTEIKYEDSSMRITGSGRIPVSIKYQVPSKTSIFVRFQIESNRAMSMVASLNGKAINEHMMSMKNGYRVESFLINLDGSGELELTFWVDKKHTSEVGSYYRVKEFMLIDTFKRGIGNVLETSNDLKERLLKVGFVLKEKLLPLPNSIDFCVKSYKKSHVNKLVIPEKSELFQYVARRTIDGLNVRGIEGDNPFKSFVFYQTVTESMKNSLKVYFTSKVEPIFKVDKERDNTFATNISINGSWKTLKNWYTNSVEELELTSNSEYLTLSTLLTDNKKEAINNCLISDIVLSNYSDPVVYSTSYLKSSENWTYLPIFRDGYIGVTTDSEYFADVEVLHS